MVPIFRWLGGLVLGVVSMGAADQVKRSFSVAERAQGYTETTVLALPKAGTGSTRSLGEGESAAQVRTLRHFQRFDGLRVIAVPAGERAESYIKRLQATGLYEWVEKDRLLYAHAVPSDPEFTSGAQWALRNTGQSNGKAGADIQAVAAWDVITDASTVVVGVIDSGVKWDHPDLAANMWRNPGESGNGRETNGIDDDGNGYIDDVFGINATIPKSQPGAGNPADDDGHGTAVAGVVGAVGNNGLGVTGVAWNAKIMALKFLTSDGTGATSDAIECMDYAVMMGARIINASYGSSTLSQAESAAMQRIKNAGIIMVAASGNEGLNNDEISNYPSNYAFENLVAVGSSTRSDLPATSSNFGSGKVDLYAPGAEIRVLARNPETPYTILSGTSFAAPHVAGALALIKSLYPQDTPRESINRLLRGVDRVDAFVGKAQSSGRLNLARALASAATPFNDQFSESALLAGGFVSVRTTNDGASREASEPPHAGVGAAGSLWWSWTAPESTRISLDTHGSLLDTTLAVYTGNQLGGLSEVAANDNDGGRSTSGLTFNSIKGTTYHIAVDGRGGQKGMILLNLRTPPSNDAFQAAREVSGP
ncbi:MAG TPA: S8 family serine peptidase, partial [Opitutaceae bacterium]|nr:S8 family serine peptidase [Opitutaceae bacterium]